MRDSAHTAVLTRGILLVSALCMGLWVWYASGWADDFPYRCVPEGGYDDFFNCRGSRVEGAGDLWRAWRGHYLYVNGRLSNLIAFGVLMLPLWMSSAVQGAMYALFGAGMARLIYGRKWGEHPAGMAMLLVGIWIVLPWEDCHASQDFLINYLWSGALNVWVLAAALESGATRRKSLWALAAVAAAMHEAVGASMDVMLAARLWSLRGEWREERGTVTMALIYMACSVVPLCSPALETVMARQGQIEMSYDTAWYQLGVRLYAVWAALCLGAAALAWRRGAERGRIAIYMAGIAAGVAVGWFSRAEIRAYWWPLTLSMACGVSAWRVLWRRRAGRGTQAVAAVVIGAGLTVWQTALWREQRVLSEERDAVMDAMREGQRMIVMPVESYNEVPWWLMNIPGCLAESGTIQLCNMAAAVYGDDHAVPVIVARRHDLGGMRGDTLLTGARGLPYYVSRRRLSPAVLECVYGKAAGPAVNPVYSLRHAAGGDKETVIVVNGLETGLSGAEAGVADADSVWFYRPTGLARSLYGHKLIYAKPWKKR